MGMLSGNNTRSLGTAVQLSLSTGATQSSLHYRLTLITGDITQAAPTLKTSTHKHKTKKDH